jgi:hypothetical protein
MKNISYRPNHVYRRRRNCGTTQVATERGPLSAGSPRLVLSYLHVIILDKVRNISKRNINENLKRKSVAKLVSKFHQNLNTNIK